VGQLPVSEAPTSAGSLRGARLDVAATTALLTGERQCVLSFVDEDGWPRAVVLSYLWSSGSFWVTAIEGRAHVRGMRRDPRVTVTVERHVDGRQMLAQRGQAAFCDNDGARASFFTRFAGLHAPGTAAAFRAHLDTPERAVIEIKPVGRPVTHDSRRLAGDGRGTVPSGLPAVHGEQ
jgi:Pyridoxamine 5'-phosphate oxidase